MLKLIQYSLVIFSFMAVFLAGSLFAQQLAFPTAEGWGKYTVGGRGGKVYEVTNLNDDNQPGSLRYAVNQSGPRTVVFRVSGTIVLKSRLEISHPYITIAGQTAPGDGICLRRYALKINADQIIVRYLRIRYGDESGGEDDAVTCGYPFNHIILDHISASWSVDECVSIYRCDSVTVQWCMMSESLYNSNHEKGHHGFGGIWGGPNTTFHHNLFAHHSSRNPRFSSGSGHVDYRNNVIYNWGYNSAYGGEKFDENTGSDSTFINMVGNYYKPGPGTKSGTVQYRIVAPTTSSGTTGYGSWYVSGNYMYGYEDATNDNVTLGIQELASRGKEIYVFNEPFKCVPIKEQTAEEAYLLVLQDVGASLPRRDSLDMRIIREVTDGTATYGIGSTYNTDQGFDSLLATGMIDSQTDVGGWPVLSSEPAPDDTDHDGMPDSWETDHGLNPNDPEDRNDIGDGGFTNLEIYLNSMVEYPTDVKQNEGSIPSGYNLEQNYPNPFNPSTKIGFSVPLKTKVRIDIYDILGRKIEELLNEEKSAGNYEVDFAAGNLSSGVYIYRINSNGYSAAKRMLLLK